MFVEVYEFKKKIRELLDANLITIKRELRDIAYELVSSGYIDNFFDNKLKRYLTKHSYLSAYSEGALREFRRTTDDIKNYDKI